MADIPDSVRSKLRKMVALASDPNANEHEAAMASSKVQALLAEYNLEMSALGDDNAGETAVDRTREALLCVLVAGSDWETTLLRSITENNFCMGYRPQSGSRIYKLIGRRVNIQTTIDSYLYLVGVVNRLCPITDGRRLKAMISWKDGCADRLVERLRRQRQDSEAASRSARGEGPRGNGADLVLADVYSSEEDLNQDFRNGDAPGTAARRKAENAARWEAGKAEREARWAALDEATRKSLANETKADRERREAALRKQQRRWRSEDRLNAGKRDHAAYAMGRDAGDSVNLDRQIGHEKQRSIG